MSKIYSVLVGIYLKLMVTIVILELRKKKTTSIARKLKHEIFINPPVTYSNAGVLFGDDSTGGTFPRTPL